MPIMGLFVIVVILIALAIIIAFQLGILPEPQRKCSKCGSKNTTKYLWKPGIAISGYKRKCHDCGDMDIVAM